MSAKQPLVKIGQGTSLRLVHEEDIEISRDARASGTMVCMLLMLIYGWVAGLVTAWLF